MKPQVFASIFLVTVALALQATLPAQSWPLDPSSSLWTKATIPQGFYINIAQISTPHGNGISIDTIGYPGALDWNYTFFAYYNQLFTVPETGTIEIKGYFYYNDTAYVVHPSRKYIAAYLMQPDLSTIITMTRILDYENNELPGIWYYKALTIQNLTPGQQYRLAFGRYDHFQYERFIQAAWAAVDLAPPHLIKVPQDFPTIQEAVSHAIDGDTIKVGPGTYHENIVIDKTITLTGEDQAATIIDANKAGPAIQVVADNVTITGFTVRNASPKLSLPGAGILLDSVVNTEITQNILETNDYGVRLQNSNNTLIIANMIQNNTVGIQTDSNSQDNIIYHNNLVGNSQQAQIDPESSNQWDNGFEEGNYWSAYSGDDLNKDGVGDTMLPWQIVDYYPLMNPFIEGDINHSGVVNIADATLLGLSWQTTRGEPEYNPHVDLNMDNTINIIDATIIGKNWMKTKL